MRGRGYEQEMSREPPSPSRTEGTTTQSGEEEMTDWGGVGWGGVEIVPFSGRSSEGHKQAGLGHRDTCVQFQIKAKFVSGHSMRG